MEETRKKVDIWSIFMYLILYSIAGFIIETVFGIFTKGVIESRKSFLYGPFCAIYGIGAISMILLLRNEKNWLRLFFSGAIIGAFVEYMMSFICEKYFGVKWWDYSNLWLNLNGRTSIAYAFSWGLLAIVLIKFVNPYVDKFIDFLRNRKAMFKGVTSFLIAFFVIDAVISAYAIKVFYYRISLENDLNIIDKNNVQVEYSKIKDSDNFLGAINQYYDNKKMLKTYPNMMIEEKNDNMVYIGSLIDGIDSYYYRLGEAF